MDFRTIVSLPSPDFRIGPFERVLFVGSCFADSIGARFRQEQFRATVNPYGVMYNPASIFHTVERHLREGGEVPQTAFLTLGTNHVYRLRATGEIVDNCQKRPQSLFREEELSVQECADWLCRAIALLCEANADVRVVLTVSPIRYRKYGYHGSQLSKATLLLAADRVVRAFEGKATVAYFPAYEIVNDELRDYRFYAPDMLHPSQQAVDYIWERLADSWLSPEARAFIADWEPVRTALCHRPFDRESPAYREFQAKTHERVEALHAKWPAWTMAESTEEA